VGLPDTPRPQNSQIPCDNKAVGVASQKALIAADEGGGMDRGLVAAQDRLGQRRPVLGGHLRGWMVWRAIAGDCQRQKRNGRGFGSPGVLSITRRQQPELASKALVGLLEGNLPNVRRQKLPRSPVWRFQIALAL